MQRLDSSVQQLDSSVQETLKLLEAGLGPLSTQPMVSTSMPGCWQQRRQQQLLLQRMHLRWRLRLLLFGMVTRVRMRIGMIMAMMRENGAT